MNNKRWLTIIAVFAVGCGIGYGLTWLVVAGPGPTAVTLKDPKAATTPPVSAAPAVETVAVVDDVVDPPMEADTTVAVIPVAEDTVIAAVEAAPDTTPAAPTKPATWWEACHKRSCRVDFGRIRGGLSMRQGALEHLETIDWRGRFGSAKKIGTLPVEKDLFVELHAVGMTHGLPAAAYITWRGPTEKLTGIISLVIGEKTVSLDPPPDE